MKKIMSVVIALVIIAIVISASAEGVKLLAFGKHWSKGLYTNGQTWVSQGKAEGEVEIHVIHYKVADKAALEEIGLEFPADEGDVDVMFVHPATKKGLYAANRSDKWAAEKVDTTNATGTAEDSLSRLESALGRYKDGKVATALTKFDAKDFVRVVTLTTEDGQKVGVFYEKATGYIWYLTGYGEQKADKPDTPEEGPGTGHRDPEAPQGGTGTGHRDPQAPQGTGHRDPQEPSSTGTGAGTGHR